MNFEAAFTAFTSFTGLVATLAGCVLILLTVDEPRQRKRGITIGIGCIVLGITLGSIAVGLAN